MKSLIVLLLLVFITSCGKGSGGSSSEASPSPVPVSSITYDEFLAKTEYTFHLVIESCDGAQGVSVAFIDKTWPEENRIDWNVSIDYSLTTGIYPQGREVEWEVTKVSGGCPSMTMKLYRQYLTGVPALIETKVIVNDGDSATIAF